MSYSGSQPSSQHGDDYNRGYRPPPQGQGLPAAQYAAPATIHYSLPPQAPQYAPPLGQSTAPYPNQYATQYTQPAPTYQNQNPPVTQQAQYSTGPVGQPPTSIVYPNYNPPVARRDNFMPPTGRASPYPESTGHHSHHTGSAGHRSHYSGSVGQYEDRHPPDRHQSFDVHSRMPQIARPGSPTVCTETFYDFLFL